VSSSSSSSSDGGTSFATSALTVAAAVPTLKGKTIVIKCGGDAMMLQDLKDNHPNGHPTAIPAAQWWHVQNSLAVPSALDFDAKNGHSLMAMWIRVRPKWLLMMQLLHSHWVMLSSHPVPLAKVLVADPVVLRRVKINFIWQKNGHHASS